MEEWASTTRFHSLITPLRDVCVDNGQEFFIKYFDYRKVGQATSSGERLESKKRQQNWKYKKRLRTLNRQSVQLILPLNNGTV
jgi:hypothetical protein